MITYGSKSKLIAKETLVQECPNCGTTNSLDMHVYQRYAHIFWIPTIPMSKVGISRCSACNQVLTPKEMPADLVTSYKSLKTQTTTPAWMYSGLALTAGLIIMGLFSGNSNDEKNAILLSNPAAGDFLEIKMANGQFTVYRVIEINRNSVLVKKSPYVTKRRSGLEDLKKLDFLEDEVEYTTKTLKSMLKSGALQNIDRA